MNANASVISRKRVKIGIATAARMLGPLIGKQGEICLSI